MAFPLVHVRPGLRWIVGQQKARQLRNQAARLDDARMLSADTVLQVKELAG